MEEDFNFDAPQFVDFSSHDFQKIREKNVEAYFEVNHEDKEDPLYLDNVTDDECAEVINTKIDKEADKSNYLVSNDECVEVIITKIDKTTVSDNECAKIIKTKIDKTTGGNNLGRSISNDNFFGSKNCKENISSQTNSYTKPKFVSSAEFINKLQVETPERFHSKPAKYVPMFLQATKPKNTVPYSPRLTTKQRARPTTVLSSKELEEMEIQKQKKYQIKANPLNKKILEGPTKGPVVARRTPTKVQPFKLTIPVKKEVVVPDENREFHAQPLPKMTYSKPRPVIKTSLLTQPEGPKFLDAYLKKQTKGQEKEQKVKQNGAVRATRTIPKPFAFIERDEKKRKQKEIKILEILNQQQDKERKSREFHARPLPHSMHFNTSSNGSIHSQGKTEPKPPTPFKARPAEVIYKEPFLPEMPTNHVIHVEEFQLSSEKRAAERKEFEKKLQEKQERLNEIKQIQEEKRLLEEEQEKAKLRKEAEYKAQPIKKYKELKVVPANKITVPLSPSFCKNRSQHIESKISTGYKVSNKSTDGKENSDVNEYI